MAFYIKIMKVSETSDHAMFEFETTPDARGMLSICKATGKIELLREMPGDNRKFFFHRASYKVMKHWKSGALPDLLEWAS